MHNKTFFNIKWYIINAVFLYLIYMFNVLYYIIFYPQSYKLFKILKTNNYFSNILFLFYYVWFYPIAFYTLVLDLYFMLSINRYLNITFFYIFYVKYIYKIIKFFNIKQIIKQINEIIKLLKIKNIDIKNIYIFLIEMLELHYNWVMKVHLFKNESYLSTQLVRYKNWLLLSIYNTKFYIKFCAYSLIWCNIMLILSAWINTYYIRFLRKISIIKSNYRIKKIKNNILFILGNKINKILDKIFQNYNIKITLKYYYNKIKKYVLNSFNIIALKIINFFILIREFYFKYFINAIFFSMLKNKGNLIFYYIFLFFKYFKSFCIWFWQSDKIYNFLKKLERKKW